MVRSLNLQARQTETVPNGNSITARSQVSGAATNGIFVQDAATRALRDPSRLFAWPETHRHAVDACAATATFLVVRTTG
jgi:hypothetical protein